MEERCFASWLYPLEKEQAKDEAQKWVVEATPQDRR
jgi:hypothetical protein